MNFVIRFTLLQGVAILVILYLYLVVGANIFRYMCWRASGPRTRYLNPSDFDNVHGFLAWMLAWPILLLCWHGVRVWYRLVRYRSERREKESV